MERCTSIPIKGRAHALLKQPLVSFKGGFIKFATGEQLLRLKHPHLQGLFRVTAASFSARVHRFQSQTLILIQ